MKGESLVFGPWSFVFNLDLNLSRSGSPRSTGWDGGGSGCAVRAIASSHPAGSFEHRREPILVFIWAGMSGVISFGDFSLDK